VHDFFRLVRPLRDQLQLGLVEVAQVRHVDLDVLVATLGLAPLRTDELQQEAHDCDGERGGASGPRPHSQIALDGQLEALELDVDGAQDRPEQVEEGDQSLVLFGVGGQRPRLLLHEGLDAVEDLLVVKGFGMGEVVARRGSGHRNGFGQEILDVLKNVTETLAMLRTRDVANVT
jgi:hypothetical protein